MELTDEVLDSIIRRLRGSTPPKPPKDFPSLHLMQRAEYSRKAHGAAAPRAGCLIAGVYPLGVRLVTLTPAPTGALLVLWLRDDAGEESAIECMVRRSAADESGWDIFILDATLLRLHTPMEGSES